MEIKGRFKYGLIFPKFIADIETDYFQFFVNNYKNAAYEYLKMYFIHNFILVLNINLQFSNPEYWVFQTPVSFGMPKKNFDIFFRCFKIMIFIVKYLIKYMRVYIWHKSFAGDIYRRYPFSGPHGSNLFGFILAYISIIVWNFRKFSLDISKLLILFLELHSVECKWIIPWKNISQISY